MDVTLTAFKPNDAFDGHWAVDPIAGGKIDRLWKMIFMLRSGVASWLADVWPFGTGSKFECPSSSFRPAAWRSDPQLSRRGSDLSTPPK